MSDKCERADYFESQGIDTEQACVDCGREDSGKCEAIGHILAVVSNSVDRGVWN